MFKPRVAMNPPGERALANTPVRAMTFLRAIATRGPIRDLMSQGGYTTEDHAEGCVLLTRACEYRATTASASERFRARRAMAAVHDWVTTHFPRLRAALERLHPEAVELFPIVDTRYPEESLLAMARLIERLRTDDDEQLRAIRPTLEHRRLDQSEIERLGELVVEAQTLGEAIGDEEEVEARTEELVALYTWYREWAETAKRLVKRKDYRLLLGLGRRGKAE